MRLIKEKPDFELDSTAIRFFGREHLLTEIAHLRFLRSAASSPASAREVGGASAAQLLIDLASGERLELAERTQAVPAVPSHTALSVDGLVTLFTGLSHIIFKSRMSRYQASIEEFGWCDYGDFRLYPQQKLIEGEGRKFSVDNTGFLRSRFGIELRPNGRGVADHLRRGFCAQQDVWMDTQTDTDVILTILEQHYGLWWGTPYGLWWGTPA